MRMQMPHALSSRLPVLYRYVQSASAIDALERIAYFLYCEEEVGDFGRCEGGEEWDWSEGDDEDVAWEEGADVC